MCILTVGITSCMQGAYRIFMGDFQDFPGLFETDFQDFSRTFLGRFPGLIVNYLTHWGQILMIYEDK